MKQSSAHAKIIRIISMVYCLCYPCVSPRRSRVIICGSHVGFPLLLARTLQGKLHNT